MKKFFCIVCAFFLCASFFAEVQINLNQEVDFWSEYPSDKLAKAITDRMTDEELLSQILMFGWAGAEPNQLLFDWVSRGLGSVKVFGWNTDDIKLVAKSITNLQKRSVTGRFRIPLFVATDQEGGWIRHVKGETLITPGNMAIGSSGYPADSWYSAFYISREIKALGINMNFAPTVDLFTDHDSTIIGTRSFGDNPEKAGILGAAWASGSEAAGVIPTVKHFPGHGDTSYDSHINLPEIDVDFDTFTKRELVPFMYLIKQKVPAVMSGHLSFPKIDPTGTPASLSKYFLTDLLRGQLGFEGLIITDDMMMNGATMFAGSLSAAFKMAIEAGNDIVISSKCAKLQEALWVNNLNLMGRDSEFHARVKDAAYRVIKAKLDYFKGGNAAPLYPDPNSIAKFVPDRDGQKFFLEQACRSVAVEKQTSLPLDPASAGKVLFVGSLPKFFQEGKKRFKESGEFSFTYEIGPNETQWVVDNIGKLAGGYDTLIVLVYNERTARIAQWLKQYGKRTVIFSIMTPTASFGLDWADDILVGYSYSNYTMQALFGALCGEYQIRGTVPFKN
ncbi:MAG: glycoside hydrolase family 3 protein [Treponema sp.]|nr:glycoside hydrolase family 3 protein [Treponema sp.]